MCWLTVRSLKPDGTVYVRPLRSRVHEVILTPRQQLSDEHADTQVAVDGTYGGLNALRNLKLEHPGLKSLLSIGGGGKGSDPFPGVAASSAARERFGTSAKELLDKYDLDGLDSKFGAQSSLDH